ncbi:MULTISPECIES: ribosome biogenesis GTP-binding protein YihA/YsxC [Corallincola]|uniref:Probable GTP-binding protein EngB n=3 Tax=Corallincola TaxID=1775176 RepID=A0A368N3P5_9GAMM|nr:MULTISPECIES: ribosome biogenesis GTP-binding protein YihA/YsxC [Corallincola]RCU45187.1 YihA family ribosome biogenesis GTP-binding protein [Corallincola holothuriorum]TAA46763.1 YihA family ribosome biogenesis GTP-binding protein [Corallincola spongiicola]TCI04408.1 YihA family ribosome biogenesis GTP-binding protein [Corallincola luteus]
MQPFKLNFRNASFITSAAKISQLTSDGGAEVAFAGRSNAGKSSSMNTLCVQTNLARTSKTPGRTQLINLFDIGQDCRLVDLPGYGFAKVPLELKEKWQLALTEYLEKRESLCAVVVLMDVRHPLKEVDQMLLQWAVASDLPVLALLTKCDKLKSGARKAQLLKVREAITVFGGDIQVELFSSLKKLGVEHLSQFIETQCYRHLHGDDEATGEESVSAQSNET